MASWTDVKSLFIIFRGFCGRITLICIILFIAPKLCFYSGYNFQWIEWLDNIIIGP